MPWTDDDVERFRKGLTAEQKKKWVAIADATLLSCQKKGGTDCEAMAVRIANSKFTKEGEVPNQEGAAPLQVVTIRESLIDDYGHADIVINEEDRAPSSTKHEMVVTLLREGPGNRFHNNYYTRGALESAMRQVKERPKQYFNHAPDVDNPDRDIRDWASSIIEAWIENGNGSKAQLKARVKVLDNWLWERAISAPEQLAVSIEGRGAGRPETIEGVSYNAIYEIARLNGVNWVDYPGNAGMGVQVLESETEVNQEVIPMALKDILEGLKALSEPELAEVKAFFPAEPPKEDPALVEAAKVAESAKLEAEKKISELSEGLKAAEAKVAEAEAKATDLANKVDAFELKAREDAHKALIERLLKASKLEEKHITATFRATLEEVKAQKVNDKELTEEEQMKQLIEDREKICIAEVAQPSTPGVPAEPGVSVDEQHRMFTKNVFGIDVTKIEPEKENSEPVASKK